MNGLPPDLYLPPAQARSQLTPIDVDDALQYTPLSSVVPLSADIIPLPTLTSTGVSSIYQSEPERRHICQTLDNLDREAGHDPGSKVVRKYLSDISSHLSTSGGGTEFRFKSLGKGANEWSSSRVSVGVQGGILKHGKIGKFGEMVLNKSNVTFRYPISSIGGPKPAQQAHTQPPSHSQNQVPVYTPNYDPNYHPNNYAPPTQSFQTPHSYKNKNRLPATAPQTPSNTSVAVPSNGFHKPSPIQQSYHQQQSTPAQNYHQQPPAQNHLKLPKIERPTQKSEPPEPVNGNHTQPPTPPVITQRAEFVKIPPPPPSFDRSQYEKHTEIERKVRKPKPVGTTSTSKSRKRKRSHSDAEDEERLASGVDQRAKAESLLKGLQSFMNSIFEAEDNLSPDTSDRVVDKNSKMWMTSTLGGESPCLSTAVQTKLENAIQRVISFARFGEIPVDDLARLQKICESSLKLAENTDVMVKEDEGESATQEWLERVNVVDNGLKTAKTVLRIMVGGREEKQIYSEDLLAGVLSVLKNLIETTVNPMIEMRSTGEKLAIFKVAAAHKKILGGLLHEITSVFALLSKLLAMEEVTEGTITTMEFIAVSVIFIENASNEKDSVFGVQKVERFRVAAMDVLAKIFARYPDQRTFIFDEILTSLEKLPVNRQSARQFKLVEGKNIQLVSALIMRLVQTSGTYQGRKRKQGLVTDEDGEVILEKDEEEIQESGEGIEGVDRMNAVDRLHMMSNPLLDSAQKNAAYVVNFLVQRAMKSTKTGDQPYRVLMDIFTEDFIAVLGSPEWPGAELLLRSILGSMCTIVDGDKQTAPAKSMALDLLGLMGSAICDVVVHLRESHRNRESLGDSADGHIIGLTEKCLESSIGGTNGGNVPTAIEEELIDWEGPFRYALEHLLQMMSSDGSLQSACGYYLTVWSARICNLFEKVGDVIDEDEDDDGMRDELVRVAGNLKRITLDKSWIDDDFDVEKISQTAIRQAYVLTVLHMPFCMSFEHILNRLLRSVDDNQATTRSKGLKAILQLLQKDPGILKRPQVVPFIIKRLKDPSPLVRDSAVDLIGKCIQLQPDLEDQVYKSILERASDAGVGVRKRAMKILKDIYLRSKKEVVKVAIAEALVQRIKDNDTSVSELARKTFEEIWITPFYGHIGEEETETAQQVQTEISPQMKLIVNERVAVIVKVVQKEVMLTVLHDVIKSLLHTETKNCTMNFRVCKTMVGSMCDDLLDRQGDSDKAERQSTLQTLTVFARANPKLFTPEQLIMLQPYIENLTAQDDLHVFRSVIVIFRCALPVLSNLHVGFLATVQQSLLKNLSRLPSPELKEVISCLWTINGVLKNPERLIRVTISCLTNILKSKGKSIETKADANRLVRTLHILGLFGKNCNFENETKMFKDAFPQWKGPSVSGLITDTIIPFCEPSMNSSVRKAALESLCHVCQTHAVHFLKPQILKAFDQVFDVGDKDLMNLVLLGIKGFLQTEEIRSEPGAAETEGKGKDANGGGSEENGRLDQLANANQNDGVSTSLAQKYLKNIIQISMGSQDVYALTATEVIGSILRQGLVHPKECVPALVALETSTNPTIQAISFREHRTLHSKHETIVERGYMDGVKSCFLYQRNVIGDASGATANPFMSKMRPLYDIVKTSRKVRKKFLGNMTMSVDFEPAKLELPNHLEYSKFVIENLAFFEYGTLDELYQVVTTMERVVAGTGMTVAHSIETDIFFIKIDVPENEKSAMTVDPEKLKTLSAAAGILSMLWEARTYLRKLYALNDNKSRDYKANKVNAKDMNKAPNRNANFSATGVWQSIRDTMQNLETDEGKMRQCREFVEILSVDNEFKLAAEGEDLDDIDATGERVTPGAESDHEGGTNGVHDIMGAVMLGNHAGGVPMTPSSKGKKRKVPGNTPEKGIGRAKKKPKPRSNKPKKE